MSVVSVETNEVQADLGSQELYTLEQNLKAIHRFTGHTVVLSAGLLVIIPSFDPLILEDHDGEEYLIPREGFPTL